MKVAAYEGEVENGRIRVLDGFSLPEKAKVYIVLPDVYEVELPQTGMFESAVVGPVAGRLLRVEGYGGAPLIPDCS